MPNGSTYIETHHVVSLAAGGHDIVGNVIGLCPNHHRQAHHGESPEEFQAILLAKLESLYRSK